MAFYAIKGVNFAVCECGLVARFKVRIVQSVDRDLCISVYFVMKIIYYRVFVYKESEFMLIFDSLINRQKPKCKFAILLTAFEKVVWKVSSCPRRISDPMIAQHDIGSKFSHIQNCTRFFLCRILHAYRFTIVTPFSGKNCANLHVANYSRRIKNDPAKYKSRCYLCEMYLLPFIRIFRSWYCETSVSAHQIFRIHNLFIKWVKIGDILIEIDISLVYFVKLLGQYFM